MNWDRFARLVLGTLLTLAMLCDGDLPVDQGELQSAAGEGKRVVGSDVFHVRVLTGEAARKFLAECAPAGAEG